MAKTKKKTAVKAKKKKWFQIIAPKQFNEQPIAECPLFNQEELVGRKLTMNMMTLMKDPRMQGISVTFEVTGLNGDKGVTKTTGYNILPASMKRMVRRGKDRLDFSIRLATKDNARILIKPIILTRNNTTGSIHKALAEAVKKFLVKYVSAKTYDEFVSLVLQNKLQREMFNTLKKVYPLAVCKIRSFKLYSEEESEEVEEIESEDAEDKVEEVEKTETAEKVVEVEKTETAEKVEEVKETETAEKVEKVKETETAEKEAPEETKDEKKEE